MKKNYEEADAIDMVKEPSLSDRIDQAFMRLTSLDGRLQRCEGEASDSITELAAEIRRIKEFIGLK